MYTRPDLLWWGALCIPALDSISVRVREIRLASHETLYQQQVSYPCNSKAKLFKSSIVTQGSTALSSPDDCFIVDDQLAIVPARFARAYFSDEDWHSPPGTHSAVGTCSPNATAPRCTLRMASSLTQEVGEQRFTQRLRKHCVPVIIHPFNASIGLKHAYTNSTPGGNGELRTVSPELARKNIRCWPVKFRQPHTHEQRGNSNSALKHNRTASGPSWSSSRLPLSTEHQHVADPPRRNGSLHARHREKREPIRLSLSTDHQHVADAPNRNGSLHVRHREKREQRGRANTTVPERHAR